MKKYSVIIEGNTVLIRQNGTAKVKIHDIREFVFGQMGYNQDTEKYPNYVHKEIWQKWNK